MQQTSPIVIGSYTDNSQLISALKERLCQLTPSLSIGSYNPETFLRFQEDVLSSWIHSKPLGLDSRWEGFVHSFARHAMRYVLIKDGPYEQLKICLLNETRFIPCIKDMGISFDFNHVDLNENKYPTNVWFTKIISDHIATLLGAYVTKFGISLSTIAGNEVFFKTRMIHMTKYPE